MRQTPENEESSATPRATTDATTPRKPASLKEIARDTLLRHACDNQPRQRATNGGESVASVAAAATPVRLVADHGRAIPEPPWFSLPMEQRRLLGYLELLGRATLADLAEASQAPKSTVLMDLRQLLAAGFVIYRDGWTLGPKSTP